MLKKKQLYRKDKRSVNKQKGQNDPLNICEHTEESRSSTQTRGRQLNTKTVVIEKKNMESTHSTSQNLEFVSKNIHSVKGQTQTKKTIINSKNHRANSYALDEEYESSDSDNSIRMNRRREVLEATSDLPENLKNLYTAQMKSLNNSEELPENYENSDDLVYNCEDNLTNEIERILIDIYNNHISFSTKKKRLDISKYEKHIKFFSQTLNKQYNIFILQILSEKIKELINRYKEKIFEIPEIKQIRDRYYEIKASLVSCRKKELDSISTEETAITECLVNLTNSNLKNSEAQNYIQKNNQKDTPLTNTGTSNTSPNSKQNGNKSKSKSTIEFNEPDKSVTKILLLELRNIKKSLIESSRDIEKVFKLPLSHVKINNKHVQFSIEEMHREEFTNTLIEDEFISALIAQIKTIAKQLKIEEINSLISQIEEDLFSNKKEMSRFTAFLITQLKSFIESDYEEEEHSNYEENSSDNNNTNNVTETTVKKITGGNSNSKNYTTTNSTSNDNSYSPTNKPTKIANDIGIDELIEYIEKPDETKAKKNKKKLKKKKNAIKKGTTMYSSMEKNSEECDLEVENFKKCIMENQSSGNSKKIRPQISKEWIKNIVEMVNVKI